jgi:flagellar basal-body rod protein FlgC
LLQEGGKMGLLDIFKISASGLKAQRTRMEVIASNLANAQTTRTEKGGPYKKREVVFSTTDVSEERGFRAVMTEKIEGVRVEEITESNKPFEKVFDPGNPDADPEGYVEYPNVNAMEEMTDMVAATRAYEANITAVNATKEMFMKALEIAK